jgi:uracil-DNA glycosylase
MYTIFVGDKPSPKNVSQVIPFVGTQSYKTLLDWIWKMDVDITFVMLANKNQIPVWLMAADDETRIRRHTYVALGNEASKELERLNIQHFKLPHPSGRNRLLNNKKFIDSELEKCKNYIKEKRKCARFVTHIDKVK